MNMVANVTIVSHGSEVVNIQHRSPRCIAVWRYQRIIKKKKKSHFL